MRRIALFTETYVPKVDGIVTRLKHTVSQLVRLGDAVLVFAPERGVKEYGGAPIYGVSGFPLPLYPELTLSLPRPAIGEALAEFRPDVIHVVNPAVLGLAGVFYAKTMGIPLLASYHTHLPQYLQHYGLGFLEGAMWELIKQVHNQAQLNLCTSTAMVAQLQERGVERLDLWQKGVDTDLFHPQRATAAMRDRLTQGHPTAKLLLYVGRLSAEKEIQQIASVLQALPDTRLALVGDGPFRGELEKLLEGMPVHFAGYLEGEDLAAAFAVGDAFVFPSRTETLGLVLLEAMAAGCPVVAARAGGIPDIVTDGVNGYLFAPDVPNALTEAVTRLLAEDTTALRQAARTEASRWSWEAATRQLQGFYDRLAAKTLVGTR